MNDYEWNELNEGMTPEGKIQGSFVLKEKPTFAEQAALMGIELPVYPD